MIYHLSGHASVNADVLTCDETSLVRAEKRNSSAMHRPMPCAPPVMTTILSLNSIFFQFDKLEFTSVQINASGEEQSSRIESFRHCLQDFGRPHDSADEQKVPLLSQGSVRMFFQPLLLENNV